MSRIFISHSSKDNRQAVALKQWLSEQRPELVNEIFLDISPEAGLRPGQRWKDALKRASDRCEAVICLLSRNWEGSHNCKVEYLYAEALGKQILVTRLEKLDDTDITSEWQRCDLFAAGTETEIAVPGGPPVRFNTAALCGLRREIEGARVGPHNFVWPPSEDPPRAPYRGWEPLEDIDAGVFFGRDAAIVRGLDELRGMRRPALDSLFVVLGPSGSGKSSFLRAGLVPRLQHDDRHFVVLGILRPERNALTGNQSIAAAIDAARQALKLPGAPLGDIEDACRAGDLDRICKWLLEVRAAAAKRLIDAGGYGAAPHEEPTQKAQAATAVADEASAPTPDDDAGGEPSATAPQEATAPTLVLPVDQAEELFSSNAGPQAEQFLTLLAEVLRRINADEVGLIVAATIRTDRYAEMQKHPALNGIGTVLFNKLKPMLPHQFPEVITGPAARATEAGHRLTIAEDLVERLISDAAEGADTLPLLALTLERLFRRYASTGEITLENYEAMGGMRDVVNNEIEDVLAKSPYDRETALGLLHAAVIPWLVTIESDTDPPMRRVALQSELPAESLSLIDAFVEKRLLVRDKRGGQLVVEVALESLLRQWQDLSDWLLDKRQDFLAAADVERAARSWEKYRRDDAWLLHGRRLTDAETLAAKPGFAERLAAAADVLAASRQRENDRLETERQRHRDAIARWLVAEAKAMLSQSIPGGDIRAFQQLLVARHLQSEPDDGPILEALVSRASTLKIINTGRQSCVAFSPNGRRLATGSWDAVRLWDPHTGQPIGAPLTGHTESVTSVAYSPDGQRLASGSSDETVRLWNADTGQPIRSGLTEHTSQVNSVAFSPDGRRLASGHDDATVRLWDAHTGQPIGSPLTGHTQPVTSVAFSPDGQRLATGSRDQRVRLWDAHTAQPIGSPLTGHTQPVTSVAFSPDGQRLATGSHDQRVRLWDAHTSQPIDSPLTGHTQPVTSVAFSPDGQRLASGSDDGTVRVWPGAGSPDILCAKLTANISRKQWREWVSPDIEYIPVCPGLPVPRDDES